ARRCLRSSYEQNGSYGGNVKAGTALGRPSQRLLILIQDLAELEALENIADIKAAREALGETDEPVPWAEVKARFDFEQVRHLAGGIASDSRQDSPDPLRDRIRDRNWRS